MKNTTNAATPIECVQKGGDPEKTVVWACGTCKIAHSSKEYALECCAPNVCEACGVEYKSYCEACAKTKQIAKGQALYDKAEKVTLETYDGTYLQCDHCNEYFADVDSLLDGHQDCEELPTWAWGTYETPFTLDAHELVSQALEQQEFYDEAFDQVSKEALDEMQVFFDAWLKKQEMKSYMVDNGVVVNFDKEAEAYGKEAEDTAASST